MTPIPHQDGLFVRPEEARRWLKRAAHEAYVEAIGARTRTLEFDPIAAITANFLSDLLKAAAEAAK